MAGRLTIIGGGVMGLMTAYQAAPLAESVTVLWREFERESGRRLLVDCGCLNLAKGTVTPDLASTYAVESYAVLEQLQLRREAFDGPALRERFPQFDADGGWLDVDAGFADLAAVTQSLRDGLAARGVRVVENTEPLAITWADGTWIVATSGGPVESDALVVVAVATEVPGGAAADCLLLWVELHAEQARAAMSAQPRKVPATRCLTTTLISPGCLLTRDSTTSCGSGRAVSRGRGASRWVRLRCVQRYAG